MSGPMAPSRGRPLPLSDVDGILPAWRGTAWADGGQAR
jgi:hypothetical protein